MLVGAPPAYSADGQWVAFSARPLDGTQGPDIYVWRVGDARARQLTTDHASVFAAWDVDQILGSTVLPAGQHAGRDVGRHARPGRSLRRPGPRSVEPSAGRITPPPQSCVRRPALPTPRLRGSPVRRLRPATPSAARRRRTRRGRPSPAAASAPPGAPVVSFLLDPVHRGADADRPPRRSGARSWTRRTGASSSGPATWPSIRPRTRGSPRTAASSAADWQALVGPGDVTATPLPGSAGQVGRHRLGRALGSVRAAPGRLDRRRDGPVVGRLSLFAVNADGSVGETLLADIAALPGLSLGSDRLAWASPPGQNGQGSTISVYAWSDAGPGSLHGAPDPGSRHPRGRR